ncbi:MAG: hypothetical protein QNJ94_20300 [Alphaproteobacteria bacterium]|nr:hypothetical protein [Alphaproteobacteria bacterium]
MAHDFLYNTIPPWVLLEPFPEADMKVFPAIQYQRESTNYCSLPVVRFLRGCRMRSEEALWNEMSAALQFYGPRGDTWNVIDELLEEMYEWMPGDTFIILIWDAQDLLLDEDPALLRHFLELMNDAGDMWSKPVTDNRRYNRPAVPFHTICQYPKHKEQQVYERYQPFSDLFAWSDLADVAKT